MGVLGIKQLKIDCIIGDQPWEREKEQTIVIDLKVWCRPFDQMGGDCLTEVVDYVKLKEMCRGVAVQGKYQMLEKLAVDLVEALKVGFSSLEKVWVRVEKPAVFNGEAIPYVEWESVV